MPEGTVLITGCGFLTRGLLRRAQRDGWEDKAIVYSRDEAKHAEARRKYPNTKYVLGDILDTERLTLVAHGCQYLINTAAIKYIPQCEHYPSEALRVNVDGARSVVVAASNAGIQRTVLISTDKAAAPLNMYGATKMLNERLVFETADLKHPSGAEFVAVRYGNVVGSSGSLWPVWRKQFEDNNRISVTDPVMTRFFMSIDDAVNTVEASLIIQAGTVLVSEPAAACIGNLAEAVTWEWEAKPYVVVGRRPGEKTHEDMATPDELERMLPYGNGWILYGPTRQLEGEHRKPTGMTSDTARPMSPEEFITIAEDSEGV